MVTIRRAELPDVPAILDIHNQGIIDRIATLDLEPHTLEQKISWFQSHSDREPILVADDQGQIAGFAALTLYSSRVCYQHVSTLTIYVRREYRGRGVGSQLLTAIIAAGREQGFQKIILNAFAFNQGAMALYQKHGFRHVGTYERQGQLDGNWVDVVIMEKLL